MPKFCVFDASGYLFRAYHALPPLTTSSGQQINAVFGYARMISKVLAQEKPDYVAVCFDVGKPTFRHEAYMDYKATRAEPDPAIIEQIPVAYQLSETWGLPVVGIEGFEADDVIATLAKQAEEKGWDTLILSGDKDILQLVGGKIVVRDELRKKDYDEAAVHARYGIPPRALVDYLSLMGDAIDNVVGVPGVGDKTATKLLQENGSLEGLFRDMKGVKPALKEKLARFRERVELNRTLVRLRDDVPVGRPLESFRLHPPDQRAFGELLKKLEFKGEFYGFKGRAEEAGLTENLVRRVRIVLSDADLGDLKAALAAATTISYDVETDDLSARNCGLVGLALAVKEGEGWYVPVGHTGLGVPRQLSWETVAAAVRPFFLDPRIMKCGQNLKFDNCVLRHAGLDPAPPFFDTMIAAYCLAPDRISFGLKNLAADLLGERMVRYEEIVSKKQTIAEVPVETAAPYAAADAEVTLRLKSLLERRLRDEDLIGLFESLEMPLVEILREMEERGVLVDRKALAETKTLFSREMRRIEEEIYALAGERFKLNSPKQMSQILFEKLKLPTGKRTKTGYSTNEEVLIKLAGQNAICEKILSYREYAKLISTYVDALDAIVDSKTERIHTSFQQTGTSTGRLSSNSPNLQNIPVRTEKGRAIRRAFIPASGFVLVSADYSQIDLRALAHMSDDEALIRTFRSGGDVHTMTAAEVFHVEPRDVTADMRRKAKAINFGIVYGQQAWALSQALEVPLEEAQAFIERYFERYAGVRRWITETLENARRTGVVKTVAGRRRAVPDLASTNGTERGFAERVAINTPIQGSSADIIKYAMIRVSDEIARRGSGTRMLLQIHDELVFEVPLSEWPAAAELIRDGMENAFALKVPLLVDVKAGPNWDAMEKVAIEGRS